MKKSSTPMSCEDAYREYYRITGESAIDLPMEELVEWMRKQKNDFWEDPESRLFYKILPEE